MSATLFILLAHPAQILALDVDTGECRTGALSSRSFAFTFRLGVLLRNCRPISR